MTDKIIDGKTAARDIEEDVKERATVFQAVSGRRPRLDVILVGNDQASEIYVRRKTQVCERVGIQSLVHRLDPAILGQQALVDLIGQIGNMQTDGLLVQLPLPAGFDKFAIFDAVPTRLDVDVFHPLNVGRLLQGRPYLLPCTPHAVLFLLARYGIPVSGKRVAVINRSHVVGRPLLALLLQDTPYGNATVTLCHDHTPPDTLAQICLESDIIVSAVGKAGFIQVGMLRGSQTVIDVGITRLGSKVVGDLSPEAEHAAYRYTPVPGGVGPVTIAMLMHNTMAVAESSIGLPFRPSLI